MERPTLDHRGISLMEMLVAFGVLTVLAAGSMQVVSNLFKTQKQFDLRGDAQNLEMSLKFLLSSADRCRQVLRLDVPGYKISIPKASMPTTTLLATPASVCLPAINTLGSTLTSIDALSVSFNPANNANLAAASSCGNPSSAYSSVTAATRDASAKYTSLHVEKLQLSFSKPPIAPNSWLADFTVRSVPTAAANSQVPGFITTFPVYLSTEDDPSDPSNRLRVKDCSFQPNQKSPEESCIEIGGIWLGNETGKLAVPHCNFGSDITVAQNELPQIKYRDLATNTMRSVAAPSQGIAEPTSGYRPVRCLVTANTVTGARAEFPCDSRLGSGYKCWFNGTSWVQQYKTYNFLTNVFTTSANVQRTCDKGVILSTYDSNPPPPERYVYQALPRSNENEPMNGGHLDGSWERAIFEHDSGTSILKCQTQPGGAASDGEPCVANTDGSGGYGSAKVGSCIFVRNHPKGKVGGTAGSTALLTECKGWDRMAQYPSAIFDRSVYCAVDKDPTYTGWGIVTTARTFAVGANGWLYSTPETIKPCHSIQVNPTGLLAANSSNLQRVTDSYSDSTRTGYGATALKTLPGSVGAGTGLLWTPTWTPQKRIDLNRVKECLVTTLSTAADHPNIFSIFKCENDGFSGPINELAKDTGVSWHVPTEVPQAGSCVYLQNVGIHSSPGRADGWYYLVNALSSSFWYTLGPMITPFSGDNYSGALTYWNTTNTNPHFSANYRHCNSGIRISP